MLLNDVIGQAAVKKILLAAINNDRLASTYLFYGPEGVGKWAMAHALAAILNCEAPLRDDAGGISDACGKCRHCRQIAGFNFGEIFHALPLPPHKNGKEAAELTVAYLQQKREEPYRLITSSRPLSIPIDSVREIKRKVAIRTPKDVRRLVLFHQMDKMLPASADSLLKLIEEPPPDTIIVLTTAEPDRLLPTVISRAQKIRFRPLSAPEIADHLIDKYQLTPDRAAATARLGGGSMGQALELIDSDEKSSWRQTAALLFKEVLNRDNPSAVALLNELINPNHRGSVEYILSSWQSFLSDLINIKYAKGKIDLQNLDFKSELEAIADKIDSVENLTAMVEEIKKLTLSLNRNIHVRPALSALVLRLKRNINQSA